MKSRLIKLRKMTIYQINDDCGDPAGALRSSADEKTVRAAWKKVYGVKYTDDEREYIYNYCGNTGEMAVEELEALLTMKGYSDSERIFLTDIAP